MGRRIEVELTSARDDGSWTWRAAGAKKPKGDVAASLLYDGAKVGDVVKVEAEFHLDGIEVTEVFAPKAKKERTDLLEMKSRPLRDDELVTTQRVARNERRGDGEGRGRGRGRRDDRGDRGDRGGRSDRGERGERKGNNQRQKPEADRRPRPKRLRPRRVHRDAMLAEITEEHRPIVEQVMKDGMPGVRAAVDKQNAEAKEAGKPEIDSSPILAIAEKNLSKARLAEWRDRADAALADAAELDIRDLRSVVVAGADVARDDESRAIADQIKTVLDERLESDHAAWLADLDNAVTEGRVVRGLRLSSRPVKAGAPLPTEIASKLSQQASDALASDVMQDRWATVLDALAFSPVRGAVTPVGLPAEPGEELLAEVRRLSDRIPAIAALFNIDPAQVPKSAKRRRPPRKDAKDKDGKGGRNSSGRDGSNRDRKDRDSRGRGDNRGGRRGEQDRKPMDPSATKPGARPVPGAEKPVEPEEEPTAEAPVEDSGAENADAPGEAETTASDHAATEDVAVEDSPSEDSPAEEAPAAAEEPPAEESPEAVAEEAPAEAETDSSEAAVEEPAAEPEVDAAAASEPEAETGAEVTA